MNNAFAQPQSVIVLGGTSDIARALVRELCAARTTKVVLAGRHAGLLAAAADEARSAGAKEVHTVVFDAEDVSNAAACVDACLEALGGECDMVIMAVGLLGNQHAMETDPAEAARMMTVNLTWPVAALTQVRNRFVAAGRGRIVVLSSVAAVRVRRGAYLYSGAKAGLDRLLDGMADSLRGTGVTLHLVRPGFVRSKMTAGLKEAPFTTDVDAVATTVMSGLAAQQRVIWSPPVLKYVFAVARHLPATVWRAVMDR